MDVTHNNENVSVVNSDLERSRSLLLFLLSRSCHAQGASN